MDALPSESLCIIWSSADAEVALNMAFMYARNSLFKGWWRRTRLLVWGPSARVLSESPELQKELESLREAGVELWACKACADKYGVAEKLETLGLTVQYTGQPLTDMLKQGWKVLTF
ncbi:DsrE family protein [Desulfocurvibacter africanus]|uniref:DsrE family protein n=1 Tax=Desulfocurvibacter africanus TaxID=873 RepID=UPI000483DEC9|nr:DsrE family protein [Desulfocurvibacter africanus]